MTATKRAVVFDTETTGLDPRDGHRVIEIACVELIRDLPSGAVYHTLLDPERDVPPDATRVHGFTREHLAGKPRFAEVTAALLAFIGESPLIAHNAPFDMAFLNAELSRAGHPSLDHGRAICTLMMAKGRFPGLPNSLDALCRRYGIDLSERTSHNALLDCRLLSDVYLELTGGRQPTLLLEDEAMTQMAVTYQSSGVRRPVLIEVDQVALERHAAFLSKIKGPMWLTP